MHNLLWGFSLIRLLNRYKRREEKVGQEVMSLFIGGVNTSRMKRITQLLVGKDYSARTLSRINKELTEEMRVWVKAPIQKESLWMVYLGWRRLATNPPDG